MIVLEKHLKARHIRFLRLICPDGTICVGQAIGADLARWGYVERTRNDRYMITEKGRSAVESALHRTSSASKSANGKSPLPSKAIPKTQALVDQAPQASTRRQGR